jgi:hypothetical protein
MEFRCPLHLPKNSRSMKANFSLSIPKPCSEDWNSFTPTSSGGFCSSCSKNVIDFTKATDDEIIAFISKKSEHACGRFRTNQLKAYTLFPAEKIRPGFMLLKSGAVSLLLLLISKPSFAQSAEAQTKRQTVDQVSKTKTQGDQKAHVIRGVVRDEMNAPLPGVSVVQNGTANGAITTGEGEYEITLEPKASQSLTFSFIGLKTQDIYVTTSIRSVDIIMEDDNTLLSGEIVITGEVSTHTLYTERASGVKIFWNKIKNLF